MLEKIGQAKYISPIDLTKGYWQIPIVAPDREKTIFRKPWDLFQFKRMSFGLHRAADSFQCLMDKILTLHQEYASAYIDNILIFSGEWEEHYELLSTVLSELRRTGLTVNPRKCASGKKETRYLGFLVGQGKM